MDRKFEVGRTGLGWDRLVEAMQDAQREGWLSYTNPPTSLESLRWNWKEMLSYDPAPALERLHVPVLAIYGELDTIVATGVNRARLQELLGRAGNCDLTVKVLPGANHNFFAARTGGPAELPGLSGFVPAYFEAGADWLEDVLHARPARPVMTAAAPNPSSAPVVPVVPLSRSFVVR
jgi:pimeloyl-ACP methyl ester carboxylesterase